MKFTLTLNGLGGDRLTVNTALVVPELPSTTVTSLMLNAGIVTVVATWAVLLARKGSMPVRETEARLVIVPDEVGVTMIVIVALVPPGTSPSRQRTRLPITVTEPCDGVAETNVTPAGR